MILWFLRCFTAFTDLEAALDMTTRNYEKQSGVYGDKCRIEAERDSLKADIVFVRAAHNELKTENLRLKDRQKSFDELRAELSKANALNSELVLRIDESRRDHIKATETVADFVAQLKYGKKIFDHVPELPQHTDLPQPERILRPQARDLVNMAERQFAEQVAAFQQQQNGTTPLPENFQ